MKNKHNKKRNVGLMYELLLRHISNCLIDGNSDKAKKATNILERRFNKSTELYKEFRLFNALIKTSVDSTEIAAAILKESKDAARRLNIEKLKKEKSALIREVNYAIKDKKFYYRSVPEYRQYANTQNMICEWQKCDSSDLKKMVELEQKSLEHLLESKKEIKLNELSEHLNKQDSNRLTQKIMTKKINEKYSGMSTDQKEILKEYALYANNEKEKNNLIAFLETKKKSAMNVLSEFSEKNDNKYIDGKIRLVEDKIKSLDMQSLNDRTIVRFLTLTELIKEIKSGE